MYIPDESTHDLTTLHQPHPAEHGLPPADTEEAIERFSRRALIAGCTLPVFTFGAALTAAILSDISLFTSPAGQLFAVLSVVALISLATGLLVIAGLERIARQQRTLVRRAVTRVQVNADIADGNRKAIGRLDYRIANLITAVEQGSADLNAVKDELVQVREKFAAVPDYGKGVIDGATMRANALGSDDL